MDRLIKEKLQIRYYTRYMDDMILIHESKEKLQDTLRSMQELLAELRLEFNNKTQIFPITNGVEYLGWRFSLTKTGKVMRRLKKHSKIRWQHRLRKLRILPAEKRKESLQSYRNHMRYGNTFRLYHKVMSRRDF